MERTRPTLPSALPLLPRLLLIGLAAATSPDIVPDTAGQVSFAGDLCKLKDGSVGRCRSIGQCDAARDILNKGQTPVICSFEEFTPIVCCPLNISTTGAMAAKMCDEYAEAVYIREPSTNSSTEVQFTKKDTCAMLVVPFIVGGEEASPNEFPHTALLGYVSKEQPKWLCGGSLISERYILTAAHCLQTQLGPPVVVRLGELNLKVDNEPNNQHVDYGVEESVLHPEYQSSAHYNDLGLVKLDKDVNFTRSIRPACLNTQAEIQEKWAMAAGWGRLEWADLDTSDMLMKLKLPLHPSEVCRKAYRTPMPRLRQGFHGESMICAGVLEGNKSTCQGDSGGPLQTELNKPYCMYNIIGITNFGKRCGLKDSPSVFARVSYFLPWIESIVWPS